MSDVAGASPTLTLKVSAPTAIEQFRLMAIAANELKAALAGLNVAGGGAAELRASLKAQELELTAANNKLELMAAKHQQDMLKVQARGEQMAAASRKKAAAEKAVEEERENAAALARLTVAQTALAKASGLPVRTIIAKGGFDALPEAAILAGASNLDLASAAGANRTLGAQAAVLAKAQAMNAAFDKTREAETSAMRNRALAMNAAFDKSQEAQNAAMRDRALAMNAAYDKAQEAQGSTMRDRALAMNAAFDKSQEAQNAAMRDRALAMNAAFDKVQESQHASMRRQALAMDAAFNKAQEAQYAAMRDRALAMNAAFDKANDARRAAAWAREWARESAMRDQALAMNETFNKAKEAKLAAAHARALAMDIEFERKRAAVAGAGAASAGNNDISRSAARGLAQAGGVGFMTYAPALVPLAAGYAAGASLKEAITSGAEFQKQMAFVRVASEDSAGSIEKMSKEIIALGGASIFAPTEMAKGLRSLTQAGLSTAEAMTALKPVMALATIGEQEVGQAAETATGLMHAFKLSVKDIPHIGDAIAKAANISQTNVSEMSQAMRQASTVGAQFNVSIDQTAAMLAILAQTNIRGSSAGTALINMLREMDPASTKAKRAFKDLGVQTEELGTGKLKPVMQLLQEFSVKFAGLNQVSQSRMAEDMFNNRGVKAFLNLLSQANGDLPKFLEMIQNSNGYLQRSVDILENTAWGEWKKFVGTFESSVITAFNNGAGGMADALKDLRDIIASPSFVAGVTSLVKLFTIGISAPGAIAAVASHPLLSTGVLAMLAKAGKFVANLGNEGQESLGPMNFTTPGMKWEKAFAESQIAMQKQIDEYDRAKKAKNLSRRDIDDEALKKAQMSEAAAAFQRERADVEQTARNELALNDAKHRAMLISDEKYAEQAESINTTRAERIVQIFGDAQNKLTELRNSLFRHDSAGRQHADTLIGNESAAQDKVIADARQATKIRAIVLEGQKVGRERAIDSTSAGNAADLGKIVERLEIQRRAEKDSIEASVMSELAVKKVAAARAVDNAFLAESERLTKDIAKNEAEKAKGDIYADARLEGLRKDIDLLRTKKEVQLEVAAAETESNYNRQREFGFGWQQAYIEYENNATNAARHARDAFGATTDAMVAGIENFAKTGKLSFGSFATSVINSLIHIQAVKAAAGLTGLFGRSVSSLIAPTTYSSAGGALGSGLEKSMSVAQLAVTMHTGGIVGSGGGSTTVNPNVWNGASRFHGGGLVSGEVPIIAKHGEGVFTAQQMRAMAPVSGKGGDVNISISVDAGTGESKASGGNDAAQMKQLGDVIGSRVRQEIAQQRRPGGLLARV